MMTTHTLYTYTCKFCDAVATAVNKFFAGMINTFESIGRARAASELARQGYYKEAQALMMESTNAKN